MEIGDTIYSIKTFVKFLTDGKEYKILDISDDKKYLTIINDYGQLRKYKTSYFITFIQLRERKLKRILNEKM